MLLICAVFQSLMQDFIIKRSHSDFYIKRIKVMACIQNLYSQVSLANFTSVTIWYCNSLFQSHLPRENATHLLLLKPFLHQISFHPVPITAGWTEVVWIQSLPKAFTSDQRCANRTPDTQISGLDHLNHSATRSTKMYYKMYYWINMPQMQAQ